MSYQLSFTVTGKDDAEIAANATSLAESYFSIPVLYEMDMSVHPLTRTYGGEVPMWEAHCTIYDVQPIPDDSEDSA